MVHERARIGLIWVHRPVHFRGTKQRYKVHFFFKYTTHNFHSNQNIYLCNFTLSVSFCQEVILYHVVDCISTRLSVFLCRSVCVYYNRVIRLTITVLCLALGSFTFWFPYFSSCGNQNTAGSLCQYHGCWCAGSFRRQVIGNHGIDYEG